MDIQRGYNMPFVVLVPIIVFNVAIIVGLLVPFLDRTLPTGAVHIIAAIEAVAIYLVYRRAKHSDTF